MAKVPFKLYSSRIKINRQTGSDNFYATWSLSSAQKKKKITKKVYKSKSKPKVKTTKRYPSVISGYIVKWYYTTVSSKNATWYLSKTITTSSGTRTTSHDLWTPPENAVKIKVKIIPVSKVYRTSSSGTSKWFSTEYTSKTDSDYDEYPSAPSIESFSITNKDLTAVVLVDTSKIKYELSETYKVRLQVYKDNKSYVKFGDNYYLEKTYSSSDKIPTSGLITFTETLTSVGAYRARAAIGYNDSGSYKWSEYSSWSSSVDTRPQAPELKTVEAISSDQIKLTWSSVDNITQYKIEYVYDNEQNFDSNKVQSVTVDNLTSYIISGFETGHTILFRVRSVNSTDESSPSNVKSVVLAVKPSPPTTWSSKTKTSITSDVTTTDPVYLYWLHNSLDSSAQQYAKLEFKIADNTYYLTKENTEKDEYGNTIDKICSLSLWDLTVYSDESNATSAGTIYSIFKNLGAESIKWKVRTKGAHADYSDWSIERTIEAYEQPNLELVVTDGEGNPLSGNILESFPLCISGIVTPVSQTPISFNLSITAGATYDTNDIYGNEMTVSEGSEIFSKYIDSDTLNYSLMPSDVDFVSDVPYVLTVVVYTDAGLNATATYEFSPSWVELGEEPDAIIDFNETYRYATITPFCNYFIGYDDENDESVPEDYDPVVYIGTAITGANETASVFSSSGVSNAIAGDIYFNKSTYETYVCTLGGGASTAKWLYRTKFGYNDATAWYSGTVINGENDNDIYPNSGISSAEINNYYLNTASGDIFKCVKSGSPSEALWKYVWNCFWQVSPNITLNVYRREPNGKYITIIEGIDNTLQSSDDSITVRDPHPSFNTCIYRIVSVNTETGGVGYFDIVESLPESSVVIQWNEKWSDEILDDAIVEDGAEIFEGSILELPANIKLSDQNSNDVDLVSYIGRERPVAYYGTQKGESLTINCEFDKEDEDTLTMLRRLMVYSGDVYVREPSGLGYWANISVSYSREYKQLTIPVTLNVKPVEGGM